VYDKESWRKVLPIDMTGGMNTREDPHFLRGKKFQMLRNMRMSEGGKMKRKGWTKNHTTAMGIGFCCGGFGYKTRDKTVIELVVGSDSNIYRTNANPPGALTKHGTFGWTATDTAAFAQWRDDCYIAVGGTGALNLLYDYSENKVYLAGMAAGAAMSAASGGAGNVAELRYYRTIFYDTERARYGAPSASTAFTAATQKVALTGIPLYTADSDRVIHRIIEVSLDDETWRILTTLEDNTTTVAEDDTADITTYALASTRYEVIPNCRYVVSTGSGLLFWANDVTNSLPARMYRSLDADTPDSRATNYIDVGDTGEPITGLALWGDYVLAYKATALYAVTKDMTSQNRLPAEAGFICHGSAHELFGGVVGLALDGPRFFNGQSAPLIGRDTYSEQVGARSFELKRTWATIDKTRLALSTSAVFRYGNDDCLVAWYLQTDSSVNQSQIAIVWDYRRNELFVDDFAVWRVWECPVADTEERRVHGCFPFGFVGRLDYGVGDGAGAAAFIEGGTLSATATSLVTDRVDLSTAGSGHRGVQLHLYYGTGVDQALYVGSNDGSTFFLDVGGSHDAGVFSPVPDATTLWMLGKRVLEWTCPASGRTTRGSPSWRRN
jgi:hypothetical protein